MKLRWFILFLAFGIFWTSVSCSSDNSPSAEQQDEILPLEAASMLDVSYGSNTQQKYDIYLPAARTKTKTKVIILVHGGGWTEGDKTDMSGYVTLLQEVHPNHAVVNMNYVLADVNTAAFPNQYLDLQAVIAKLTAESETLQILPEFGLIGVSAGAHISLMYDSVYDTNNSVKMVCDVVGPTNFTDPFFTDNPNFEFLLSLLVDEAAYPDGTDYAVANSPALQLSSTTSPTILFYGNQDPLVPLENGQLLNDNLEAINIPHSFTIYAGGHGDWEPASYLDLQNRLTNYINEFLPVSVGD